MRNALTTIATRAALVLAMASPLGAHAGLVTGSWDPEFGDDLPDLSWSATGEFFVPDACIAGPDGVRVLIGACAGTTVVSASLTLFNTVPDPLAPWLNIPYTESINFLIPLAVRVVDGQVHAVSTTTSTTTSYPYVTSSLGNGFSISFGLDRPTLTCVACNGGIHDVESSADGLTQVLTTFNNNGTAKLVDPASGRPLGVLLDRNGVLVRQVTTQFPNGTPVPEPGSLPLVLGALVSAVWLRRRNAR